MTLGQTCVSYHLLKARGPLAHDVHIALELWSDRIRLLGHWFLTSGTKHVVGLNPVFQRVADAGLTNDCHMHLCSRNFLDMACGGAVHFGVQVPCAVVVAPE